MLHTEGLSRKLVVVLILIFVLAIDEARIGPRCHEIVDCQGVDTDIVDYVEEVADAEIDIKQENVSHRIFVHDEGQIKEAVRDEVEEACTHGTLRRILQQSLPSTF